MVAMEMILIARRLTKVEIILFSGSKVTDLDAIASLDRFQEPPMSGPFCDLIWADPLLEEVLGKRMSDKDYKEVRERLSVHVLSEFL